MRIAWATPFRHTSAIGRVSASVTAALAARGHDVQLLLTEHLDAGQSLHPAELHPTSLPWKSISGLDLYKVAAEADIVVAQIGDHYLNHAGIFRLFAGRERGVQMPLLGIFHDFFLHNLFIGWLHLDEGGKHSTRSQEILTTYGPEGLKAYRPDGSLEDIVAHTPMTEWIAAKCDGGFVHANFYRERVQAACPGPLGMARLPVVSRDVPALPLREAGARLTALTVGFANPNKAAEQVIAAIAASPNLKERLEYRLTGPIDPDRRAALSSLAVSLGYGGLRIEGQVDDETLALRLRQSDIIICLRRPVLEGASGSAVEALLAGRPLLVADAGSYGEMPDGVVAKVPAQFDPGALTSALERLCANERLRTKLGAAGRDFAEKTFRLDTYTQTLETLMGEVVSQSPTIDMSRTIGQRLSLLSLSPQDQSVARLAARLQSAFGN